MSDLPSRSRAVAIRAAVLAAVLMAGAVYFFDRPEPVTPALIAPVLSAPLVEVVAPVDAGTETFSSDADVDFADGFCTAQGGEQFELKFSLEGVVNELLSRKPAAPESDALKAVIAATDRASRADAARTAAAAWPSSVAAQVLMALDTRGDERLLALRRARKLAPKDPAIGWAIADATRDSGELDEAIDGLSAYLQRDALPGVSRLRARLEVARDIQSGYSRESRNGVTILWPPANLTTAQAREIASTVDRELDEAAAFTGTQRRAALTVVVYPSRSELLAVSCARSWAAALYDGTLRVVVQDTPEGVDPRTVRHETLHAQLSPSAPNAPRWFHEGVAQSFEPEKEPKAWTLMVRNRTWIPFSSLEGSFFAFEASRDASLAYAQSYAMVELMRELGGDGAISVAREAFASGADTATTLAKACRRSELTGADLLAYLSKRLHLQE